MTSPTPLVVLLVDDEAYFRRFVGEVLRQAIGCTVVEAQNGDQALAQCRAIDPDLVMLDINMPHVDGVHALPQIRALKAATPVVMLTSVSEESVVEECVTLGASYFIRKDVRADQLKEELQEMLRMFFPAALKANEPTRSTPS